MILVGFMGTGKSTVAKLLSERLGWSLIDLDQEIERKQGRRIADIFESEGEEYFRRAETEALRDALQRPECAVIATGGGAVLAEENRSMMLGGGFVAALAASEERIVERVMHDSARPLLRGDVAGNVRSLLERRRGAYDFAHVRVDTDRLDACGVADYILAHFSKG